MSIDEGRLPVCIIALVIFIIVRAFYTACEYALIEVNDSKVKSLAERDKKYQKLFDVISKPQKTRVAFSSHKAFSSIIISFLTVMSFGMPVEKIFEKYMSHVLSGVLSLLALIIVLGIVLVVFTDILPKKLVGLHAEKFALLSLKPVEFLRIFYFPFSCITAGISWVICRIFRLSADSAKDSVTEEEILMMVEAGNETGLIEESQREMINNIFEFDDSVVSDVMTHRKDVTAVDVESKIGDVVYLAINEGYSRIPVYEKTIDNIVGILNVKDLLCLVGCENSEDFNIRQFMRKPEFVPENARCNDVLEEMTRKKTQMMIISDEYGGTLGIVTMEDLLEEIVGNIQDEYDDDEADISEIDKGVFIINGSADPEDVFPKLGIDIPDDNNYDTMSAFFVDRFGRVPNVDEKAEFCYSGVMFRVLLVEDNWVKKLKAVITEKEQVKN
ncbi:MAG: hemolysin family protein [Ruminococcus sp.]|nr:hemolysin family protein [Oscillospiraceae bacterium]MDY4413567.1 hemolysin family protein [Ruminococcus sp.]